MSFILDSLAAKLDQAHRLLEEHDASPETTDVLADILALIGVLEHLIRRYNDIIDAVDF